jgi:hypothetical protein
MCDRQVDCAGRFLILFYLSDGLATVRQAQTKVLIVMMPQKEIACIHLANQPIGCEVDYARLCPDPAEVR